MRMRVSMLSVVICGVVIGVGLLGYDRAGLTDAELQNVYGGDLPRDCVRVRFPGDYSGGDPHMCAAEELADCYMAGDYCTETTWKTSCYEEPKYCASRETYSGECQTLTVTCSGTYDRYECTPDTGAECSWEHAATYSCAYHTSGDTTKDWCQEI